MVLISEGLNVGQTECVTEYRKIEKSLCLWLLRSREGTVNALEYNDQCFL